VIEHRYIKEESLNGRRQRSFKGVDQIEASTKGKSNATEKGQMEARDWAALGKWREISQAGRKTPHPPDKACNLARERVAREVALVRYADGGTRAPVSLRIYAQQGSPPTPSKPKHSD
jgi:hypothetical protein